MTKIFIIEGTFKTLAYKIDFLKRFLLTVKDIFVMAFMLRVLEMLINFFFFLAIGRTLTINILN